MFIATRAMEVQLACLSLYLEPLMLVSLNHSSNNNNNITVTNRIITLTHHIKERIRINHSSISFNQLIWIHLFKSSKLNNQHNMLNRCNQATQINNPYNSSQEWLKSLILFSIIQPKLILIITIIQTAILILSCKVLSKLTSIINSNQ